MVIAFKKRHTNGRSAVNSLISWWTESEWVHCEILLNDPATGQLMAVSARTDDGQVSARGADTLFGETLRGWVFYRVPVADVAGLWGWLLAQCQTPYDYRGLLHGMVLGQPSADSDQWFCSELCLSAIQRFSQTELLPVDPAYVSPGTLRAWLIEQRCERVSLINLT